MHSFGIYALAWNILSFCVCVGCINWGIIAPPEPYPKYFENDSIAAVCSDNKASSSASFLKDNTTVAVFNESGINILSGNIVIDAEIGKPTSRLLVTWILLTKENSGTYTCEFNQSYSAHILLQVVERPKTTLCESGTDNRQEYLVGEQLELTCYNPFNNEDPDLLPKWYVNDTTQLQGMKVHSDSLSRVSMAKISLGVDENSTIFNCYLAKNDTIIQNRSHSCSVGPFFVYNSSFIRMESFEGSSIPSTKSGTINCRIVPRTKKVSYYWIVDPPGLTKLKISASDTDSNLTLSGFELGTNIALEIRIACVGKLGEQNFTAEHILTVSILDTKEDEFVRYILVAASAVLVAILMIVFVCSFILRTIVKRVAHRKEKEASAKDMEEVNDNGADNTFFGKSGFDEDGDEYMSPHTLKAIKQSNPGPSAFTTKTDYYSTIDHSNAAFLPKESFVDPAFGFPSTFGRYSMTPRRGSDRPIPFDAYGRPIFAPRFRCLPSTSDNQTTMVTSPEMMPTEDDELSYDESFCSQPSNYSEDYPPKEGYLVEECVSMNEDVNYDHLNYENDGVRK